MDYEAFLQELHQVRWRTDLLVKGTKDAAADPAAIEKLLAELDTVVEELQVTDEEVRVLNDQAAENQQVLSTDRDHYRDLFTFAPAAYLVTDRVGIIREANRRAARLLGVTQRHLAGRPLVIFVAADDRWALRDRLNHLGSVDPAGWQLRVQPRHREPVGVAVSIGVIRDHARTVTGLRWQLLELPPPDGAGAAEGDVTPAGAFPSPPGGLAGRSPGSPVVNSVPSPPLAWDELPEALHRITKAAVPLLRADGAGSLLADQDGALRWVTGTDEAERAFGRAERDLGEGPCIDAFASGNAVWTIDLWADPRWPRLGPAARVNQIRGVLSAPVIHAGRPVGTCSALTASPRAWTDNDVGAIGAYAVMLGQLVQSASDARHQGHLAAQLQLALASRVLIEQAKGVLMERHDLDDQAAFTRLRQMARSSSRKVTDVAWEIVAGRGRFTQQA